MTYMIGKREFRLRKTRLLEYGWILKLLERFKIDLPVKIDAEGQMALFVGKFFDQLISTRVLVDFLLIVLEPVTRSHWLSLIRFLKFNWFFSLFFSRIPVPILSRVDDETALKAITDFFLTKKGLLERFSADFASLMNAKR
ncbi:MAG TPA: hypothetical protein VNN76_11515 [Bacteroidota bacterium]|nr:hypothetical protein [Bacteroidota bacterium]